MGGKMGSSEVAQSGLETSDQLGEDRVDGARDLLEGFDAFGCGLAGAVGCVPVAGGGAGFHGSVTPHAAVLLIEFAVDLHDLSRGLRAAGEQAAADDGIGEGERLDDVSGLGDAAVGEEGDAARLGGAGGEVKGGQLGNAYAGDDAGGADGAGTLTDLDDVGSGAREEFDTGTAGDVSGDDGEFGEELADQADGITDAGAVTVRGGDGDHVEAAFDEGPDMAGNAVAVEHAIGTAWGGDGGTAEESELGIAGGFDLSVSFEGDAFDVAEGEQTVKTVIAINDEQLVDPGMIREEAVGATDGIGLQFRHVEGADLGTWREGFGDLALRVAGFDDMAREEPEEAAGRIDDGEGGEGEPAFLDHAEDVSDELVGLDLDGFLDEPVHVVLHA